MAAKIGILGESTVTTQGSVTLYTVPADKAARVRVLYTAEAGAGNTDYSLEIGTPGSEKTYANQSGSGVDHLSGVPTSGSIYLKSQEGAHVGSRGASLVNAGDDCALNAPLPFDYYLSTGDTVKVLIGTTDLVDHLCQVMGVEDDA